jgi:hypothetical protein
MKRDCILGLIFLFLASSAPDVFCAETALHQRDAHGQSSTISRWTLLPLIKVYQTFLSPFITTKCPSWPNCSRYASEAVIKHGAAMGSFMTVDRLLHEAGNIDKSDKVYIEGCGYLIYDPPDDNDFWWTPPRKLPLPDIPQMGSKQ